MRERREIMDVPDLAGFAWEFSGFISRACMWQARATRQQPALRHIYERFLRDDEPTCGPLSTVNLLFLRLCRTSIMRTGA